MRRHGAPGQIARSPMGVKPCGSCGLCSTRRVAVSSPPSSLFMNTDLPPATRPEAVRRTPPCQAGGRRPSTQINQSHGTQRRLRPQHCRLHGHPLTTWLAHATFACSHSPLRASRPATRGRRRPAQHARCAACAPGPGACSKLGLGSVLNAVTGWGAPAQLVRVHAEGKPARRLEAGVAAAHGHQVAGRARRDLEVARVHHHARAERQRRVGQPQAHARRIAWRPHMRVVHLRARRAQAASRTPCGVLGRRALEATLSGTLGRRRCCRRTCSPWTRKCIMRCPEPRTRFTADCLPRLLDGLRACAPPCSRACV